MTLSRDKKLSVLVHTNCGLFAGLNMNKSVWFGLFLVWQHFHCVADSLRVDHIGDGSRPRPTRESVKKELHTAKADIDRLQRTTNEVSQTIAYNTYDTIDNELTVARNERHIKALAEKRVGTVKKVEDIAERAVSNRKNLGLNRDAIVRITSTLTRHGKGISAIRNSLVALNHRGKAVIENVENTRKLSKLVAKDLGVSTSKADETDLAVAGDIPTLKRSWADINTRLKYKERRRKEKMDNVISNAINCANQKKKMISVFPVVELREEMDTTSCIGRNRKEIVGSFCNFRNNLEPVLQANGFKSGIYYWPNICCKMLNASKSEEGSDLCGHPGVKREDIIPFAGSQGGKESFANVYGEVKDALRKNGYIHTGMKKLIDDSIMPHKYRQYTKYIDQTFESNSLCGPRVFMSPADEEMFMCELFYPYKHLLSVFQDLFVDILSDDSSRYSFLEEGHQIAPTSASKADVISRAVASAGSAIDKAGKQLMDKLKPFILSYIKESRSMAGPQGERGVNGKDGSPGNDGVGLKKRQFELGSHYSKGEYVLSKALRGDNSSTFVAQKSFRATKDPRFDEGHWLEIITPAVPRGVSGAPGKNGTNGRDGVEKPPEPISAEIQKAMARRSTLLNRTLKFGKLDEVMKKKGRGDNRVESTCPKVAGVSPEWLNVYKKEFCPVYRNVDLGDTELKNFALIYLQDDLVSQSSIIDIEKYAKFFVDDGCSSKLFASEDISIQEIEVNGKLEWVAVVKLNSGSANGYLQNEVRRCMSLDYVPQTSVRVRVHIPKTKYCKHKYCTPTLSGSRRCRLVETPCGQEYVPAHHYHTKRPISYRVDMIGSTYEITAEHRSFSGRRKLLWNRNNRC